MALVLIETIELGATGVFSVEFASIPQDGTDLLLVGSSRISRTTGFAGNVSIKLNGTTATDFNYMELLGYGSVAGYSGTTSAHSVSGNTAVSTTNTFGSFEIRIPNYTSSVSKSLSSMAVTENNSSGSTNQYYEQLKAGSYTPTSPITSMQLSVGWSWELYSSFSLYKIF